MATLQERVAERYPDLLPLLNHPQVGPLLRQAVDLNNPISEGSFMSKLRATSWFRGQSASARNWWITSAMDPGEAAQQRRLGQESIVARMRQLGVVGTQAEIRTIREQMLRQGLTPDDFWVTNAIMKLTAKGGRADIGAWTTTATQLRAIAEGDYFKVLPPETTRKWTGWIITGQRSVEDFQAAINIEATKRFPHMAEQLKTGMTVRDVVAPWVEIYANEFDTTPDAIMASMRKHAGTPSRQLLGIKDPKTGQTRMPTEPEAVRIARSQPQWAETTNGKQMQNEWGSTILRAFGKRV